MGEVLGEKLQNKMTIKNKILFHDPLVSKTIGNMRAILAKIKNSKILIACSGGQDSIALLRLLNILKNTENYVLHVAHVNHGIREESNLEENFVRQLSENLSFPFRSIKLNLKKGSGLALRARNERKEALKDIASELDCEIIATGHTITDQTETILMHMIRGSGLNGIASMQAYDFPWVRPLLKTSREETEKICNLFQQEFVKDPSNLNEDSFRVRIRNQLIPFLEKENPNVKNALLNLSEQANDVDGLVNALIEEEFKNRSFMGWLSIKNWLSINKNVRVGLLKFYCKKEGRLQDDDIKYDVLRSIDDCISAKIGGKSWNFKNRTKLIINGNFIQCFKE